MIIGIFHRPNNDFLIAKAKLAHMLIWMNFSRGHNSETKKAGGVALKPGSAWQAFLE